MPDLNDLMWVEATRDLEAEAAERSLEHGRAAVASLWPFLAAARTEGEFEGRLELTGDRIAAVAVQASCSAEGLEDDLRRQYRLLAEARGPDPVDHEGHDYDHDYDHDDEDEEPEDHEERDQWNRETGYSPFEHWSSRHDAYATLHTALEEGVDPLSWIHDEAEYGAGPEEEGGHDEGPVTAVRRADPKA